MKRLTAQMLFAPTLGWNVLLGRMLRLRRWWDRIDEHVVIGALPFPSDIAQLHRDGIRGVVNTCHEYAGPGRNYARFGIRQLRIRTVDFTPPSLAAVDEAIEFIQHHADRGESVYVHCKAGRARSATVVLCWLMHRHGLSPDEGQLLLRQKRPHVNPRLPTRSVVQDFYRRSRDLLAEPVAGSVMSPADDSPRLWLPTDQEADGIETHRRR